MKQIEDLLRQTIGLHAATIGSSAVEHAVRDRMDHLRVANTGDYLKLLRGSPDEWHALVELIVVTETWFFRDHEPFRAFAGLVKNEWLPAHPAGRLRILSLPCSTGEEPYSIALTLLDAEIPAERFQIDAFDLRPAAIACAQRGEYGKNSFRGKDLAFRDRYFRSTAKGHMLDPAVRNLVQFQTGNLLDDQCLARAGAYDFIFCRNLLIYFDRPTQKRALDKIDRLLAPAGVLFVGSAEVAIAAQNGFVSAHVPLSFACRKAARPKPSSRPGARQKKDPAWIVTPPASLPFSAPILPTSTASSASLDEARQLLNIGRLAEAITICEQCLRERGASAEVYYLLGLVWDAAGAETQAGEFYRKALYLEPNHYETLLHWASLAEKNGDNAHARILNDRAGRIKVSGLQTP